MTASDYPFRSKDTKKRRLSSLTLVILAVNIMPIIIMGLGLFYLDRYKSNLIEMAYTHLEEEAQIISVFLDGQPEKIISLEQTWPEEKTLIYVDQQGNIVNMIGSLSREIGAADDDTDLSIPSLAEAFAELFLFLNPLQARLPEFPEITPTGMLETFPELDRTVNGSTSYAAWAYNGSFVLSMTFPLIEKADNEKNDALMIVVTGDEITEDINDLRRDIIKAFVIVIIMTFLLSIYLSSFIAVPLKKLSRAAEDIHRGKKNLTDLPDLSRRKDEIGELSVILKQMAEALNSRIDEIQNFAADVAHEIKNPITSLRSAIETAQNMTEKEKRDGLLKIMEEDVHRLNRLITNISKHSRLDSELARENFQALDIQELIENVIDLWRSPMERQGQKHGSYEGRIRIISDLESGEAVIFGKADSLAQVFHNLISNAISFSEETKPIDIPIIKLGDKIIIEIKDQGQGIPESQLDKIFDRFYTDRPEKHDRAQNSGLGLSIAKKIIEAHKGLIFAENIYDQGVVKGAKFTITLDSYED